MAFKAAAIGDVPESWHVGPLRDVLELITYGFTNPMPDSKTGPWKITAKDVVDGKVRYETARHTTEEAYRSLLTDKSRPRIGDVLLTKDGSIGRVAVVDRSDTCINQSVALLRPNSSIESRFLAFLLRSPYYQKQMEGDSDGSTIKHIYITRVDKMEIALPPIEEQALQLGLLSALDDRIDLLRQTNTTLEAIAQALFKSWFVDFDPVRAKAEGREPEGMDAATAALFPNEFEKSELGLIPKGWGAVPFAETVHILGGGTPKTSTPNYWGGGIPWFSVVDAPKSGQIFTLTTEKAVTPEGVDNSSTCVLPAWTTIISARGTVGKLAMTACPMAMNQSCYGLAPRVSGSEALVYLAAQRLVSGLQRLAHGGVFDTITRDTLASVLVVTPPPEAQVALSSRLRPLFQRVQTNVAHVVTLSDLRDTLLPRLISGKLRLPEAKALTEESLA